MKFLPFRDQKWVMLLVVGIPVSAGLIAVFSTNVRNGFYRAQASKTVAMLIKVSDRLQEYRSDCGKFPDNKAGLQALIELPGDPAACQAWHGPYMKELPRDAWQTLIIYQQKGRAFSVKSLGRDRSEGGAGYDSDIVKVGCEDGVPEAECTVE